MIILVLEEHFIDSEATMALVSLALLLVALNMFISTIASLYITALTN